MKEHEKIIKIACKLLSMQVRDEEALSKLREMGFKKSQTTNRTRMLVSLFDKACEGNVPAFKEICEMTCGGESPALTRLDEILREVKSDAVYEKTESIS